MRLYLLRHGEALAKSQADADRPLSPAGETAIRALARQWQKSGLQPDRIWTSPLLRARQTAELAAKQLECPDRIEVIDGLQPEADPRELLESLANIEEANTILAVSHQPLLGLLISVLIASDEVALHLQPGGYAVLDFPEFPALSNASLISLWNPGD